MNTTQSTSLTDREIIDEWNKQVSFYCCSDYRSVAATVRHFLSAQSEVNGVVKIGTVRSWNPIEGTFIVDQIHKTNGYPDPVIGSDVYAAAQEGKKS